MNESEFRKTAMTKANDIEMVRKKVMGFNRKV